jgi:peptidoglycan/xylan/chitin deacetylase (PgdA/CDA1 family)
MQKLNTTKFLIVFFISCLLVTACSPISLNTKSTPTATATLESAQTIVAVEIIEDTPTSKPSHTPSPTVPPPTEAPTQSPTPNLVYHEPGEVVAPILLYHHVKDETTLSRYQVSIPDFRAQMELLDEMGYTAIPISTFLDVLLDGGKLPEKPIVITFDDGHLSVYENAFPIMEEFGFPGVFYIVANRINGSPDFVTIPQLTELVEAGWEIGSHSYTHADLTKNHAIAGHEIGQSKARLEEALSTQVETFAYPYGTIDSVIAQKVSDYGYLAGMGLGKSKIHTWNTLFYLNRIEIEGTYTLADFKEILNEN